MKQTLRKRIVSCVLAVLMVFSGVMPAMTAFAGDGVENYYDIELFYKDTDTIVPTYIDDTEDQYIEYMMEGDELNLTYKLIDTTMPNNGYVRWYSETPTLVDVNQEGVVKAFDSSKGAVIRSWLDNEVRTIPLVGNLIAKALEKVLFNEYVNVDTMDTDAIIALVEEAFGSDSLLAKWVESYKGELIDSLRYYLDNINSNIHVQLFAADGTLLDDDYVRICVTRNDEWYANFLPNGTHITNKSQINTTVAVGSEVQLYAITTPVRLQYGCIYSVKSSSIFEQGKVVATVDDSGLVKFKNKGTVTIMVSPDTEQVIENILKLVNYFYTINTELIDSHKLADILIKYIGIDMNRNVLAALLDACFAIADIVGDSADPVKLTATAVKIIANLVLQFKYNDKITFTVVDSQPLTDFDIAGANTVKEGTQIKLSITNIKPEVGNTNDITWRSSNPSIASVDENTGIITGRDAGGSLGNLSSQQCTIYAVSAANNVEKSYTITVTGRTGKYISDVDVVGDRYLEMGMETDYTYEIFPKRVAQSDNLYISWGLVGEPDEEGNTTYIWADVENPAENDLASITANGHYIVKNGGECDIAIKAQTGYYLPNGNFYEISSIIKEVTITNGIPVENIVITPVDGTSNGDLNRVNNIEIGGKTYTYVTIHKGVMEAYAGNGAIISAEVYPENASNKNVRWVVDNEYYSSSISGDTHTATVKQKAGHEVADTFNIYAVSQDGTIMSNVITVCVTRNYVTDNVINEDKIEIIRGKTFDVTHTASFDGSWDGTAYACYKCNWYSSDEGVFTVKTKTNDNRDGRITAVDVGKATLYCVTADGGIIATREVTVYPDKDYLREIVNLCDKTVIIRTKDNASLYKKYMNRLDLAYYILYDEPMASQTTCDTYATELLNAFYKLGGFVGITGVDILGTNESKLTSNHITVNVGSTSNYKDYSYDFDYALYPKNAMYSSIRWTSSNSNISVDGSGVCKPKSNDPCAAIITCTVTDYMGTQISDSVYVAFARTAATGVNLNKGEIVGGRIGETEKLTATVEPTGTIGIGAASCDNVYWTSSDESIATVDQSGNVKFVAGGDCIIKATTYDGGHTATCRVNVVTNYSALELLVTQCNDLMLNPVNYYPDTWEVYNTALNKAKRMLEVRSYSQSQVDDMCRELTAAYEGLEKYNYIQNIELYLDGEQTKEFYQYDLSLLSEGISYKNAVLDLNVRLYPNNGSYESVEWTSSTSSISVTSDGKCSPTDNKSCYGMITCTVTDHFGNQFTDSVWVSYSFYPVTHLVLSETNMAGAIGTTAEYPITCVVYPVGTSFLHAGAASIQDYYWESDNEEVATIDQEGYVTFVGAGATVVRAVSYDGGISAECIVSTEGDRTALHQALENCKDAVYTDYEYDYGIAFKEAYEAAQVAMNDISYTQERIDEATNNLNNAYNAMLSHPFVAVQGINITYTAYANPTFGGTSVLTSGTVSSNDALSIDLSKSKANYNSNNYVEITAAAQPANAMIKSVTWNVEGTSKMDSSISGTTLKLTPTKTGDGGWGLVTATIVDNYNRTTVRTIIVTMSDKVCKGIDITESTKTVYATDAPSTLAYSISGSPEFNTVLWYSSNSSVVTVDQTGTITPVEKGTAVITAKTLDGGYTDTIAINVVTNFQPLAAKQAEYYDLIEEVRDSYTYTQASLDVLAAAVAEAQQMINDGRATQAEVRAMIEKLDNAYDSLVYYIPVTSVAIGYEEAPEVSSNRDGFIRYTGTLINNKSVQLVPIFNDELAIYTAIEWTSSNANIKVDSDGYVTNTSAQAGATTITCTVTNVFGVKYSAQAYVTFTRYGVTGVTFANEEVYGAPSKTATVTPIVTNSNNSNINSAYVRTCIFESSNPAIATVDQNGVVTFISQGSATITATTMDGGYTATIVAYTTWDTSALEAAIKDAQNFTYTDYEYDYGMAFLHAYEAAYSVYNNPLSSQQEINDACAALTEAMSALEGHEFIVPDIQLYNNGNAVSESGIIEVDTNTQQVALTLSYGDGAMVKETDLSITDELDAFATVNGNIITVEKVADRGFMTITVTAVDDYNREYQKVYNLTFVDTMVPATSIALTVNGEEVGSSYSISCGGSYDNIGTIAIGYIATPANANAITNVSYTLSTSTYIDITNDGIISLTRVGKLRNSNTVKVTVKVTNADGSSVSNTLNLTITKA